tara:strand:+ start:314 stop:574 length:261 start_codon:yes stop_codon:yes gene_type:complete
MGLCYFCEVKDRECFAGYYCEECKKLQRILKLYGDDVYKTNDLVFIRNSTQQGYKIDNIKIKQNLKVDELDEKQDKDGYNLRHKRP